MFRPHYRSLRERWCAAVFGLGYEQFIGPCRVAIDDADRDADFVAEIKGREHPFQTVEVLEPGRMRGDEYRQREAGKVRQIPYAPELGSVEGAKLIARQIEAKVVKVYAGAEGLNLLVYANFPAKQLRHADVVSATSPYRNRFASIWLITSYMIGTLHSEKSEIGKIEGWGVIDL